MKSRLAKYNLAGRRASRSAITIAVFIAVSAVISVSGVAQAQTIEIDNARTGTVNNSTADAEITVTESGSITTSGILQYGINSSGESPTIINNGTITTDGASASGIRTTGEGSRQDKTTITNNGTITTNDNTSRGILADGAEAIITNNGTITTLGERSAGIRSTGDDAEITLGESGTITTSGPISGGGSGASGIVTTHENAEITINGAITTSGEAAHGVQSTNLPSDDGAPDNAIITVGAGGMISTEGNGAHGISSEGEDATITNAAASGAAAAGMITTTGDDAHGISSEGEDAEITNDGTITSSGQGIRSTGNNAQITNNSSISSGGSGIHSEGMATAITNAMGGMITTSGDFTAGIFSEGSSEIRNTGTITTSGIASVGISATGNDAEITNNGTIETGVDIANNEDSGNSASGIRATGGDGDDDDVGAMITNNGRITTNNNASNGILATGNDAEITNNGMIETRGTASAGIRSTGGDAVIVLGEDGMIITRSDPMSDTSSGAHGIRSSGEDAEITINGRITTLGDRGHGVGSIDQFGSNPDNATITVGATGMISTEGDEAHGISSEGEDANITNEGAITTTGTDAHGISATGTGDITTNGTITTSGDGAHGISSAGTGAITINGRVAVSGEGSFVVRGGDDTNQMLTLSVDAETQGEFNLGESEGDNDVANVWLDTTTVIAPTVTIGGAETINLMGADPGARIFQLPQLRSSSGDNVAFVEPTGATATRIALGAMTDQIQRQVFRRLDVAPSSDADSVKTRGSWVTLFGNRSERDEDDLALAWEHSLYGLSGGYDVSLDGGQRVGLFGGVGQDMLETSEVTSIVDSATHAFVGVYGRQSTGGLSLDGSVVFGYALHDSERLVQDYLSGFEVADGDYDSAYISPSVALGWTQDLGEGVEFRPSVQASYTYGYYGDYTESGTTNSNINFDSRSLRVLDGRLELALAQSFSDSLGEIEVRGGATFTQYSDDGVSARLSARLGDEAPSTSYAAPGDNSISRGYTGVGLNYKIADRINLRGDIEYAGTSSDEGSVSGYLSMDWRF